MPTNVSGGSSISELVQGFSEGFHLPTERRNAVRYEVVKNHKFKDIALTEPTKCSQCHDTIWSLVGKRCILCKLTSHRKCLGSINSICVINGDNNNTNNHGSTSNRSNHTFEPKYFVTPTWCHHCGVLIKGIFSRQGLECLNCEMTVHCDCKQLVCQNLCHQLPAKKISIESSFRIESPPTKHQANVYRWQRQKISIENFEIIGLLGKGSFSEVYLAKLKQPQRNEEFAIKVIKKTIGDPESILTEMRVLILATYHPFLALVHCCFQCEARLYFVMEPVIGRDLVYHVTKSRKFTEDRTRFYLAEIVLALIFLHYNGFVHRDLKLEHVILDQYGHCKLIDFGQSKELTTRPLFGSANYISPEVISGHDGFSVDWWALGVMMFEMLSGCSPFEALDTDSLYQSILEDQVQIPRYLSNEATSMLDGLLIKDPHTRLGCRQPGEQEILDHKFFLFKTEDNSQTHQWELIESKQIRPPYVPTMEDIERLGHDQEDLQIEPVNSSELQKVSQDKFAKFSYYGDHFKTIANIN